MSIPSFPSPKLPSVFPPLPEPTIKGPYALVWSVALEPLRIEQNVSEAEDNIRAVYVIYAPYSHPIWPWYRLVMFHLRPHPDFPDAIIYKPNSTHEFVLHALDPIQYPPQLDVVPNHILTPANFAAQFIVRNNPPIDVTLDKIGLDKALDAKAINYIETMAIRPITSGDLNPDTDHISSWVRQFGNEMIKPEYR